MGDDSDHDSNKEGSVTKMEQVTVYAPKNGIPRGDLYDSSSDDERDRDEGDGNYDIITHLCHI
jgi:hypothetical protein